MHAVKLAQQDTAGLRRLRHMQGCSLSSITAALEWLVPELAAYLDWRLLLRDLLAVALPGLPSATSDSLLQLKQAMQQAGSTAEGSLTQGELMLVDIAAVLSIATAADTELGAAQQEGTPSEEELNSVQDAAAQQDAQANDDDQGQAAAEADSIEEGSFQADQSADSGAAQSNPIESFKSLLCQVFFDDSTAAVDVDELMLYLSCDADGTAGLQKAFTVLIGANGDCQVSNISSRR